MIPVTLFALAVCDRRLLMWKATQYHVFVSDLSDPSRGEGGHQLPIRGGWWGGVLSSCMAVVV